MRKLTIVLSALLPVFLLGSCLPAKEYAQIVLSEKPVISRIDYKPELPEVVSFKTILTEFYAPEVEITSDFTAHEKRHIAVPDEKLFAQGREVVINVDQFADEEFVFPLKNAVVRSTYGKRGGRPHTGYDLVTMPNDTIRAAFSGIVRVATRATGYGNVLVIRHYNGLETVYAHNSRHFVKSGDQVKAGDPIGLSGRTGRAFGDHVHFETRFNGQHFDPSMLIDFKTYTLKPRCIVFRKGEKEKVQVIPVI